MPELFDTQSSGYNAEEPADLVTPVEVSSHRVQFYESEEFLASAATGFLGEGLAVGQPLVIIATEPNRRRFTQGLQNGGLDVGGAIERGQLTLLDAREMLETFMSGRFPDAQKFHSTFQRCLDAVSQPGKAHSVIRLYGEMVDILWREGNTDGALRVEALWNELAAYREFSLLCAYSMGNFYRSGDDGKFGEICQHHTHVAPTESYVRADELSRGIEIARLQQRARALETELGHSRELERRLRVSLDARRRAEESLLRREEELTSLLSERERLLAAEREARTEAESATRAKSQFLAVMSHELRTPLNAIAGHVQLLELGVHGDVLPAQRVALERVAKSQRHLLRLINELLNLAKVEAGQVEYSISEVAVHEVIEELCAMMEPQLRGKGLSHRVKLPGEPLRIMADREKFSQILLNLLSNALKFTPRGGVVTIDCSERAERPDVAFVRVSDTGIGVSREKQDSIFEPFVQVQASRERMNEGAGLGLAISRDLARGMGGDLRIRSTQGAGSTFTITLPLPHHAGADGQP